MAIQELKLDDDIRNLLMTITDDNAASSVFAHCSSLANSSEQRIPDVKMFPSFCTKVYGMSKQKAMDRVIWLFLVLMASTLTYPQLEAVINRLIKAFPLIPMLKQSTVAV